MKFRSRDIGPAPSPADPMDTSRIHQEDERTPVSHRAMCTAETHDVFRNDVALFKAAIRAPQVWGALFVGHCRNCESTLALYICDFCGDPCPNSDALPLKKRDEDVVIHSGCAIKKALREGLLEFKERS